MGTYSLNWPGLGDFPIYVVDKENGRIYSDKDPLPYERRNLNHFGHHHVLLDDVMELFSSMTMVKASIKLVLLTDNVTMYPIYKDEKTKKRYLSLDTLLAFIIVFPFCPEFQRARAAVLRFLTLYPDLTCSSCGFIQRDCRCVKIAKKPLSKVHPFDSMPEELVAKMTDLCEGSTQTDNKKCPICEDAEGFQAATSPWLVMPPGMKVRPGDRLPLPVLNNAKIINCASVDTDVNPDKSNPGVGMPPHGMPSPDMSSIPGIPMQVMTPSQFSSLPFSVLPYNLSNSDGSPLFPASQSIHSLMPQSAMNTMNPMVNLAQQFAPVSGSSYGSPYLQPLNLPGSLINQGFGGPPAPSNMSPLAPMNNNGASVPGSMGPPLTPVGRPVIKTTQASEKSPIENMHQLTAHFKPGKIKTILAKRKPSQEEAVRRGRPPKKPKLSDDFKMIGPARRITPPPSPDHEKKSSEEKTGKTDSSKDKADTPKDKSEESRLSPSGDPDNPEDLEPGEIPQEVLDEIKDSVVIEFAEGCDSNSSSPTPNANDKSDAKNSEAKKSDAVKKSEAKKSVAEKPGVEKSGKSDASKKDEVSNKEKDSAEKSTAKTDELAKDKEKEGEDKAVRNAEKKDEAVPSESKDKPTSDKADTSDISAKSSDKDEKEPSSSSQNEPKKDAENSLEKEGDKEMSEGDSTCSTPTSSTPTSTPSSTSPTKEVEKVAEKDSKDSKDEKEVASTSEEKKENGNAVESTTETKEADSTSDSAKEKPLKIQSASGILLPAEKCKDSPYYMVSPNGNVTLHERGFAEFEFGPTGEKMLRCILYGCGQCFDTFEFAELHEKTHCARGQGLECPHCDTYKVVNTRWYHLLRHMETTHNIKTTKTEFQCNFCGLDMENEEALQEHQTFHHYSHYKCIHCGITLFTWTHVQHHLKECADKEKGHFYHNCPYCHIVFHGPSFQEVHVKSHKDQGLVCCYCKEEKVWDSWKHLKKHYEIFHLAKEHKRLHKCMHCKMHFSSLKKFKVHLQNRHNPDKVDEPKVPVKRKRKTSKADSEKSEEDKDKPAKPEVVGKKSGRIRKKKSIDKSEWVEGDEVLTEEEEEEEKEGSEAEEEKKEDESKEDKDTNDEDKEEKEDKEKKEETPEKEEEEEEEEEVVFLDCPECDKKFKTQKRLDMHVERTHGEEVQCSKCEYIARNAFHLRAHELQKHGEKEHQCSECGKPFNRYFELKIHLAKHARNTVHTCKKCWQEFGSKAQLRAHKETAHAVEASPSRQESKEAKETNDLSCSLCDFTAESKMALQDHLTTEHPEDGVDHAYFNKTTATKAATAKQPKAVSSRGGRGKRILKTGKGRGRGKMNARGSAPAVGGNTGRRSRKDKAKEKKLKEKLMKERMIRKLKRSTCARTRSIDEHRAIKKQESEENVTIDETTIVKPRGQYGASPGKGRWAKKYTQLAAPARPTSSLWSDFDITPIEPSNEDLAKVRSMEMDHSYYHSTSQDVLNIRNQLRDTRASFSEDDTWAPEPSQFEDGFTSPTPRAPKGKQTTPPQLKTVLSHGVGQLQKMHGSHRVEIPQPGPSTSSSSNETGEDSDLANTSQTDSLGDLEKFIQGDMSDIMLAAEQYLQDSSLMNDSLEGIGSPNTSNDYFLQDSEGVGNIDSLQRSLQSSPLKRAGSQLAMGKVDLSPLKNSPRKRVVVQSTNSTNRQVFTLPKINANELEATAEVYDTSNYANSEVLPVESLNSEPSDSVNEDILSNTMTVPTSTITSSAQLDYLQAPDISLPDEILQSPEYTSSSAYESQLNSSATSIEDNGQYVESDITEQRVVVSGALPVQSENLTSSSQVMFNKYQSSSIKISDTTVPVSSGSPSIETIERTPSTTVVKLTNNPVQIRQSQPGAARTILVPTKGAAVPKKVFSSVAQQSGKRTVIIPSPVGQREQPKIVVRSPGAVGNMKSVFQDVQGLSGMTPGSRVKVVRVVQSPGSTRGVPTSTTTSHTQRILIPKSTVLTRTVSRPSTSVSSPVIARSKPETELDEAVKSISLEKTMVDELNDALFNTGAE